MVTAADIQKMVDLIADRFQPEKIILFGSYADGTATEDSDVDLLVVKDTDADLLDLAAAIATAVWRVPVAKDIVVRTPRQVEQATQRNWTVVHQALQEGRVLFARAGG